MKHPPIQAEGHPFKVISDYEPRGDQPAAIRHLAKGLEKGFHHQTLWGVTGSGKTYTMAKTIEIAQRPTLVICHNKTLAAQLASEFKEYFPNNAVEYFVSYYDYYQPEAYVPSSDTYIEKDASINEEIDKLRHSATRALLSRRDVLIVASVSCIYGLGSPEEYYNFVENIQKGAVKNRNRLVRRLIEMQYERNDFDLSRARFRIRGDTLELMPAYEDLAIRIEFFGDVVERILEIEPLTGELLGDKEQIDIYPAKHFVTSRDKLEVAIVEIELELEGRLEWFHSKGRVLEAQRLEQRTKYDIEMLRETGYCSGVENYSQPLGQRPRGSAPWTLLDYFPDDFLLFVDESHITLPQVHGMYKGDFARKTTLVDYGFRLPSALDNRPLSFDEVENRINQVIHVSATPGPFELQRSEQVVEQIIRPTGLLDPSVEIKPTEGQIDDLLGQIRGRAEKGERCLVTTLTKRMAEELSDYLQEMGVRVHYLHSEIDTLQRSEILRDLRLGVFDVVVGINLLREGLDLPEVSLVAILDADKEGYLRSASSLIQTSGRAARHVAGHVIMYADKITDSMHHAIEQTKGRRLVQNEFNAQHNIQPESIRKAVRDFTQRIRPSTGSVDSGNRLPQDASKSSLAHTIKDLESGMKEASKRLEFEKAAMFRDEMIELRKLMVSQEMVDRGSSKVIEMIRDD